MYHLPRTNGAPQLILSRRFICDVVRDVSQFKTYVDQLADGGGMSGDETDQGGRQPIRGQRKFLVIRPHWRSHEVIKWLRVVTVTTNPKFTRTGHE